MLKYFYVMLFVRLLKNVVLFVSHKVVLGMHFCIAFIYWSGKRCEYELFAWNGIKLLLHHKHTILISLRYCINTTLSIPAIPYTNFYSKGCVMHISRQNW